MSLSGVRPSLIQSDVLIINILSKWKKFIRSAVSLIKYWFDFVNLDFTWNRKQKTARLAEGEGARGWEGATPKIWLNYKFTLAFAHIEYRNDDVVNRNIATIFNAKWKSEKEAAAATTTAVVHGDDDADDDNDNGNEEEKKKNYRKSLVLFSFG